MESKIYCILKDGAKHTDRKRHRIPESLDKQEISVYIRNVLHMEPMDDEIIFWCVFRLKSLLFPYLRSLK